MELYGRSPARNGSIPVHQPEWSPVPAGGETGLEGIIPIVSAFEFPLESACFLSGLVRRGLLGFFLFVLLFFFIGFVMWGFD